MQHLKKLIFIFSSSLVLCSCTSEKIETGETLEKETVDFIKSLGLLSDDEHIIFYYSNFTKYKAGNIITSKRIAHYWLDAGDATSNDTSFAFYSDIASIDTTYMVPDTFAPYLTITKKDNTMFKVYVDGSRSDIKSFFQEAIIRWKGIKR